ncbi:MAG: hypothetical protein IJK26_04510 [Clostridia bacterium]|nr:hypothetical protein [Clostridia bacterium]
MTTLEEKIKEIDPDLDTDDPEIMESAAKAMILALDDKEMYDKYLIDVVEKTERLRIKNMLLAKKFERHKEIEAMQKIYSLEEDIIKHKRKVLREFMD